MPSQVWSVINDNKLAAKKSKSERVERLSKDVSSLSIRGDIVNIELVPRYKIMREMNINLHMFCSSMKNRINDKSHLDYHIIWWSGQLTAKPQLTKKCMNPNKFTWEIDNTSVFSLNARASYRCLLLQTPANTICTKVDNIATSRFVVVRAASLVGFHVTVKL